MMIELRYGDFTFTDADLKTHSNIYRSLSLLSRGLEYDVFNFAVKSNAVGEQRIYTRFLEWLTTSNGEGLIVNNGDFENFIPNSPIYIYEDGVQKALFYVYSIEATGEKDSGDEFFQVSCYSEIAVLSKRPHAGGVYFGTKAGVIIADIMGTLPYQIDSAVANVPVYGWLPYSTDGRDNLEKVLFATGANALRTDAGILRFAYNQAAEVKQIEDSNLFHAFGKRKRERWSKITVIEHGFYTSSITQEEVILDNSTEVPSEEQFYIFQEPYYDYRGDGITIVSSGANWVKLTGIGQLYAKRYIHTQRAVTENVGDASTTDELTIDDETLVSFANVENVMTRLESYYQASIVENIDFIVTDERPGDLVRFIDRRGERKIGYIQDLDETATSFWRGKAKVVTGWSPTGGGNNFSMSQQLTGSGTWRKADAEALVGHPITVVRFDLIGGGHGGYSGADGEAGASQKGGKGGEAGLGGEGGKVYSVTLEGDEIPDTITFTSGAGGASDTAGTATTIRVGSTTYSSDSGAIPVAGYIDLFTGDVTAVRGPSGIAGGDGGTFIPHQSTVEAVTGKSVTYKDRTWNAGTIGGYEGTTRYNMRRNSSGTWELDFNSGTQVFAPMGCTGGAAFGASSAGSGSGHLGIEHRYGSVVVGVNMTGAGNSSAGANALPIDDYTPTLGSGGAGGNGGGGGGSQNTGYGAGGYRRTSDSSTTSWEPIPNPYNNTGRAGAGGTGSAGTQGGAGFVNAYI